METLPMSNASQLTPDEAQAANDSARIAEDAQRAITEAARRIEQAVQEGLEQLSAQSRVYADAAGQQLEEAGVYVSDQVRARPLAATGAALGVGVLIGLLLASGRR